MYAGLAIAAANGYVAAIAAANGFTVATRYPRPFEAAGAAVINPWQEYSYHAEGQFKPMVEVGKRVANPS